jgi:polyhydroxybutyrate depolymerase
VRPRLPIPLAAAAAVTVLLAAACAGDDTTATPTTATEAPTATVEPDPAPEPDPDDPVPDDTCSALAGRVVELRAEGEAFVVTPLDDGPPPLATLAPDDDLDDDDRAALWAALARHRRAVVVAVPEGDGPHPVLLQFHGYTSSALDQTRFSGLAATGTEAGYLVVAIDGREQPRRWELRATDPGPDALAESDVAVVEGVLRALIDPLCGEADEVFAAGMSNGSVFSALLACQADTTIRAVGSVAFTTGRAGCDDDRRVPTVAIHGTADTVVPYTGRDVPLIRRILGWDLEPAEEAMADKAEVNGCDDFVDEPIGPDVVRRTWQECEADTVFYRVDGGGHGWPGPGAPEAPPTGASTDTIDAARVIVDFFDTHRD